jgi:hypothetical protein
VIFYTVCRQIHTGAVSHLSFRYIRYQMILLLLDYALVSDSFVEVSETYETANILFANI